MTNPSPSTKTQQLLFDKQERYCIIEAHKLGWSLQYIAWIMLRVRAFIIFNKLSTLKPKDKLPPLPPLLPITAAHIKYIWEYREGFTLCTTDAERRDYHVFYEKVCLHLNKRVETAANGQPVKIEDVMGIENVMGKRFVRYEKSENTFVKEYAKGLHERYWALRGPALKQLERSGFFAQH
ncbi:MAG: hypothetical protein Q9218_002554 [Villophora microphyllina]